jgi:hypothetical protein
MPPLWGPGLSHPPRGLGSQPARRSPRVETPLLRYDHQGETCKLYSTLKKAAAIALVAVVSFTMATPARAVLVTYTTTGAWNPTASSPPGTSNPSITVSGVTLTFQGLTSTDIANPASFDSFGSFTTSGGASPVNLAGTLFTLYITTNVPSGPGLATFVDTVTGTIEIQSSSAYIQFQSPLSVTVVVPPPVGGTVTYTILNGDRSLTGAINLNAPKAGGATSNPATINGEIVVAIPEPTTIISALSGVIVLAGMARFRRRRAI